MANLSAISFHARKGFTAAGVTAKLSHVQELVAAALGHSTLASYQTASEDAALAGATHVVLDADLLEARASKLGLSVTPTQLLDVVGVAAKLACPSAQIHESVTDFGDALQAELEEGVGSDDNVSSEMASCNHDGIRDISMPIDPTVFTELAQVGQTFAASSKGMVTMHIDQERPYSGHQIRVRAKLSLTRLGRRCFDEASIEVTSAMIMGDEPEAVSLPQALADFTGLDIATAEALSELDPVLESSADGMPYNYFFDCEGQIQQAAEAAVREHYPDLVVMVPAWVVDNASSL